MSVAVLQGGTLLGETTLNRMKTHSQQLLPTIDNLVKLGGLTPEQLDGVAVAQGPGSYTGLRIGVTTAKTLAYTLQIALYGVSSLAVLAANVRDDERLIVPVMDARRGNVFAGMYQWKNGKLDNVALDKHVSLTDLLAETTALAQPAVFVGASAKMRAQIKDTLGSQVHFTDEVSSLPRASRVAELATQTAPVDVDSFVPHYLRLTEAEHNWLTTHPGHEHDDNYVEKV